MWLSAYLYFPDIYGPAMYGLYRFSDHYIHSENYLSFRNPIIRFTQLFSIVNCTCVRLLVREARIGWMAQGTKKKDTIKCSMDKWFHKTKLELWRWKSPPGYHFFKTFISPRLYIVCASPLLISTFFVGQLRILRFLGCASFTVYVKYYRTYIVLGLEEIRSTQKREFFSLTFSLKLFDTLCIIFNFQILCIGRY